VNRDTYNYYRQNYGNDRYYGFIAFNISKIYYRVKYK